jgi:hypothetical protein
MMNKKLKYALYSIPLLIGGYFIYKQFAGKGKEEPAKDVPPPPPPSPETESDYPLKFGSKNSKVGILQILLNTGLKCQNKTLLVVDNNFGSKTQSALLELSGKKTLISQSEFEAIKNMLVKTCILSANLDWAWKLIDAQNSGKYKYLIVNKPVTLHKVQKDFMNKWVQASPKKNLEFPIKSNYNLNDYVLRSALTDGSLRIEVLRGEFAGMWITNPNTNLSQTFNIS